MSQNLIQRGAHEAQRPRYTGVMDSKEKASFVRGRVSVERKRQVDRLIDEHGTTAEDLLGALIDWFATATDLERRRILARLTDEDILTLAAGVQDRRSPPEGTQPAEQPAVRRDGPPPRPGALKRAKQRRAARKRKEA